MKTTLSKLLALAGITVASLVTGTAKAQANPYPFRNTTPCQVTLNYQVKQFPNCPTCYSQNAIVVNPGATAILTWGSCVVPICDIDVQIIQIGSTTGSPLVAGSVNTAPPPPISVTGCGVNIQLTLGTSMGTIR